MQQTQEQFVVPLVEMIKMQPMSCLLFFCRVQRNAILIAFSPIRPKALGRFSFALPNHSRSLAR
jgi:hypothetical protein